MLNYLSTFWWACFLLFLMHQFIEKILNWHISIFDNYLDPLLSMPIILGIHLAERQYFFRENKDFKLPVFTILIICTFLAIIFEEGFPKIKNGFVNDPIDYLCYGTGAFVFYLFMNKPFKVQLGRS